jgi:dUTPase
MVTGSELLQAVTDGTFIKGGIANCAEGIKYDFRLGSSILRAGFGEINAEKLTETEKKTLVIEPGEMVFVLTEEGLDLPGNMKAELNPKRKLSHEGILAMGGSCIDPHYQGKLLVGLLNFSSTPYRLMPGRKLIAATFYKLDDQEQGDFPKPDGIRGFPPELVQVMEKYRPTQLQELVDGLRKDLGSLEAQIQSRDEWFRKFEALLERDEEQLRKLVQGLSSEVEARQKGEDGLSKALGAFGTQISEMQKTVGTWTLTAKIAGLLFGALFVPLLLYWLQAKLFPSGQ